LFVTVLLFVPHNKSKLIGTFGVGVWKFIRKGWDSFSGFTRFVVGDDFKINFWHDLWCGDMALKVAFPTFFGIARAQDASVADKLEFLSGANQWNAGFSREAHDWEVDAFAYFLQALHSIKVGRDREDKLWWVPSKKVCSRSNLSFAPWPVLELLPLEKCVAHSSPFKGGFFCMVNGSWQDSYPG